MKKLFGILLLFAVLCISACSEVEEPEQSSLVDDLSLIATKAGARATLLPHLKIPVTPVVPVTPVTPVGPIDTLTPADPVTPPHVPTTEEALNAELEAYFETVGHVMKAHHAYEELLEQHGDVNYEDFVDDDGIFDMDQYLFAITSSRYQYLYEKITNDDSFYISVDQLANDEELNTFEKINLAYYLGRDEVSEIADSLTDEVDEVNPTEAIDLQTAITLCNIGHTVGNTACKTQKELDYIGGAIGIGAITVATDGVGAGVVAGVEWWLEQHGLSLADWIDFKYGVCTYMVELAYFECIRLAGQYSNY